MTLRIRHSRCTIRGRIHCHITFIYFYYLAYLPVLRSRTLDCQKFGEERLHGHPIGVTVLPCCVGNHCQTSAHLILIITFGG